EAQEQLERLIGVVQELRELSFITTPKVVVVTRDEFTQRVASNVQEAAEDFPADEALFKLLGLLPPEADYDAIITELYSETAAGFYDFDEEEIVVPATEEGFTVIQQETLVHELVHALTDQHFDVQTPYQQMLDEERFDEASGYLALIEGDASLVEFFWLQNLSRSDLRSLLEEVVTIDLSALRAAPPFLQDSLVFPYDSGLAFVQDLFESGGWQAVDDAYVSFPGFPPSTEQVMTPDDYGLDLPIVVELPRIDLDGYELATESVWGEASFRIMLRQGLGDDVAAPAADGWGGDRYYQWFDGENAALLIGYVGDTMVELDELEAALLDYAFNVVPEEDFVWVEEVGGVLYFIAADDPEVGIQIRTAVGAG
ncbi:MAG: hypothetical protein R3258_09680, partial [Acidimicrobiia bacterium]|nr:hypothetical protein [Acidimicrobiia bacterium]